MRIIHTLLFISIFFLSCYQKEIKILPTKDNTHHTSMRGLFAVNDSVYWASGTDGIILSTNNNGNWRLSKDASLLNLDFRDIHAFSDKEAIIMSSGDGCKIYKTYNRANSWNLVYNNDGEGIFFDGMDFWDNKNGLAFSDPIDNQIYIIETENGGDSWQKLKSITLPKTLGGEAGFAASGTGIVCIGDSTVYIGTGGGKISRIFISYDRGKNWKAINTPMRSGEASGIYSMVFMDELNGVVVGGNYVDSSSSIGNCAITVDGGLTWKVPEIPPKGYMSCVAYNGNGILVCTGRNGINVSYDNGNTWKHVSDDAYYSCVLNKSIGWLTGRDGKMAKIVIN